MYYKYITNIFILILTLCKLSSPLSAQQEAYLQININTPQKDTISNQHFGGFIEFLLDFVNGPMGFWSQELLDRGFDYTDTATKDLMNWKRFGESSNRQIRLQPGGYNENGRLYVNFKHTEEGFSGLFQNIYVDDTVSLNFYLYARGINESGNITVKVFDTTFKNLIYETKLESTSDEWTKISSLIPPLAGYAKVAFVIGFEGIGEIDIDESSCMPSNNVLGVRREYYDLLIDWNMGLLLYPGGSYADTYASFWHYGAGPIDKRQSPNLDPPPRRRSQRMDFGTAEFIDFCRLMNITPHITANYDNGWPELAGEWVQYCNGDTNTKFGRLRLEHGYPEPFDVKLWEVGNEQWFKPKEYALEYFDFRREMLAADLSIKLILAADVWHGIDYFKALMDTIKTDTDYYGFHPAQAGYTIYEHTDLELYLSMTGGWTHFDYYLNSVYSWLESANLLPHVQPASTEWFVNYGDPSSWILDTNWRSMSLEQGIWEANAIISHIRMPEKCRFAERTFAISFFKRGEHPITGKRTIWGNVGYQVMKLFSQRTGTKVYPVIVNTEKYYTREITGILPIYGATWINSIATSSGDTLYLAVVNSNPFESLITEIDIDSDLYDNEATFYEISSNHYHDSNTIIASDNITPKVSKKPFSRFYEFPKHSITIIAIPNFIKASKKEIISNSKLYPNPVNDFMIYEPQDITDIFDIEFFDVLGNTLKTLTKLSSTQVIDCSDLSAGVYFVIVKHSTNIETFRIIIIK